LKHDLFKKIVGLKYFNVFGPYEDHKGEMRSMVAKSYEQIRAAGTVKLFKSYKPEYKDGEQMRDFLYVKDAVDVTLHFALQPHDAAGGLFNCGSGKARTWLDLVHAVYAAMGLPAKVEFIEMPQVLQGKYQYFSQAEERKLRAAGYTREFKGLEEAVREYVQFLERRG
jgi:ADP-L-glycero-D-manno-heptose 6-epimerase